MKKELAIVFYKLNDTHLSLAMDSDSNYYVIDYENSDAQFDIKNNWEKTDKSLGGKKYLTHGTRQKVVDELRRRSKWNTETAKFIEWFDALPVDQPKEAKQENGENEKMNEVLTKIENLTAAIEQSTKRSPFEEAMLQGIIEKGKELATADLKNEVATYLKSFVEKEYGILPQIVEIRREGSIKRVEGLFHKQYDTILKIVSESIPLMLVGPAGSGKNHTLEQIAESLDLNFYFSNAITQEYKLTGFIDAGGKYHETEFYKSFVNGGLFFFDEIDASCAEALIIINAALANGYFDFPNGRANAHPDFKVVAAANTFGHGADMTYVGRNQLDGATLDRFAVLEFGYDEDVEKSLAYNDELYQFIVELRRVILSKQLRYIVSMRATINASKMMRAGIDIPVIMKTVITKAMTKDDINSIVRDMNISGEWYTAFKRA